MANKIPIYDGGGGRLAIDPVATGEAAFQQAGRRIGPAYNEAATLTRSIAEAQASVIKQRRWPFDMLELERSLEVTGRGKALGDLGPGFKLEGGVNNLVNFSDKLGGNGSGGSSGGGRGHTNRYGADVGAQGVAAASLGKIAAGLSARSGGTHNSIIDPLTGRDINSRSGGGAEGISVIDPRTGMNITKLPASKYDTVLDHGVLKRVDRETGKEVGGPTGAFSGPNGDAAKDANNWARSESNGAFDPNTEQGQKNIAKFKAENGYDPNTGNSNSPYQGTGPQNNPQQNAPNAGNPYGNGPPMPGSNSYDPNSPDWWAPTTDQLKQALFPGGDNPDVTEARGGQGFAPSGDNQDFGGGGDNGDQ